MVDRTRSCFSTAAALAVVMAATGVAFVLPIGPALSRNFGETPLVIYLRQLVG